MLLYGVFLPSALAPTRITAWRLISMHADVEIDASFQLLSTVWISCCVVGSLLCCDEQRKGVYAQVSFSAVQQYVAIYSSPAVAAAAGAACIRSPLLNTGGGVIWLEPPQEASEYCLDLQYVPL